MIIEYLKQKEIKKGVQDDKDELMMNRDFVKKTEERELDSEKG